MFHLNVFKLLAFICIANCYVHMVAGDGCSLGTRDFEILAKRKESSTIRFPWSVDIYQFHHFRAHGVIISNKHILVPASHVLPYKGTEVETKDNGDGLPSFFWVEHTELYVSTSNKRTVNHVYVHPNYNPITYDNNVAILEIDGSMSLDGHWARAVFLPKTPLTELTSNGKVNIAFPDGTSLKPYMASILSDDECAQINGNPNVTTNTLMCIVNLWSDFECNKIHSFTQPIFSIIPDGSIEIIGLPLWARKQAKNGSKVAVYNRISDVTPWIEDVLSKRCTSNPPTPNDCKDKFLFSKKSCDTSVVIGSNSNKSGFGKFLEKIFL